MKAFPICTLLKGGDENEQRHHPNFDRGCNNIGIDFTQANRNSPSAYNLSTSGYIFDS